MPTRRLKPSTPTRPAAAVAAALIGEVSFVRPTPTSEMRPPAVLKFAPTSIIRSPTPRIRLPTLLRLFVTRCHTIRDLPEAAEELSSALCALDNCHYSRPIVSY